MSQPPDLLRELPKIDKLLSEEDVAANVPLLGRGRVTDICRLAVADAKADALERGKPPKREAIRAAIRDACKRARARRLGRVINGTGILLHTNLGRAPLGKALFDALTNELDGYCNVEINVLERRRDQRGQGVVDLLKQVCDAEDAVVVNNNAAALYLMLKELATDKEVVVSRGELVQIGGGFRIPDILTSSGANLVEVGTTNITSASDYQGAISEDTAMVLLVHRSNFHMSGFVSSPGIGELLAVLDGRAPLVVDLGSGNLLRRVGDIVIPEPTPGDILRAGADLVCFSTDKMLGGVQGGVIAGRKDLIARIRRHPVMRVVRPHKVIYAALQWLLEQYLSGNAAETVQLWSIASVDRPTLRERAEQFIKKNALDPERVTVIDTEAALGGGSTPGFTLPSAGVLILGSGDSIAREFQRAEPPVIGTVNDRGVVVDFKTVSKEDEAALAAACRTVLEGA